MALSVESKGYGLQRIKGFIRRDIGSFSFARIPRSRGGVLCRKGLLFNFWTDDFV